MKHGTMQRQRQIQILGCNNNFNNNKKGTRSIICEKLIKLNLIIKISVQNLFLLYLCFKNGGQFYG
jgi:hypothetical protein